jgi:hypothetical protein
VLRNIAFAAKIKTMQKFYIHRDNQQQGPFLKDELKDLKITCDTMVWFEGADNWIKAIEVEDLILKLKSQSKLMFMKKITLISFLLFLFVNSHAQNKKEQIVILNQKVDSLIYELADVRRKFEMNIAELNSKIEISNNEIQSKDKQIDLLKSQNEEFKKVVSALKQSNDSLSNQVMVIDKELKSVQDSLLNYRSRLVSLPKEFYGLWNEKGGDCCNSMGCFQISEVDGVLNVSGLEWSSRYIEIEERDGGIVLNVLGYSEGSSFNSSLLLFFKNEILFVDEVWGFEELDRPLSKDAAKAYIKCPL